MTRPMAKVAFFQLMALGAAASSAAQSPGKAPAELTQLGTAREFLAKSDFEKALETAEDGLEIDPESVDLLDLAARAAEGLDEHDLALWYLRLEVDLLHEDSSKADLVKSLKERIKELDLVSTKEDLHGRFESYSGEIFNLARTCENKGYFVNALELYGYCKATRHEAKAEAQLDKIFDNPKARTQLAETGIELPAESVSKSRARRIANFDKKHGSWETVAVKETANYKIMTSGGLQVLEDLCEAMEIMNRFYRDVFEPKKTQKCEIRLYQSREEFDRGEGGAYGGSGPPREVRGFFSPSDLCVATYLDDGDDVWTTLFHEASHQFTREVTEGLIPGWMNEGTASYFEGARLLPNGAVQTNGIPESRLEGAQEAITLGEPALGTVINFFQPGSYPGPYYPVGWALVYFIHNFEDEKCERVYIPPYKNYLRSYRKPAKNSPMERFVEHFVVKAKQPGIQTFEQFEERWKNWILDLYKMYMGGPQRSESPDAPYANPWIVKAHRQLSFKKTQAAIESYRYALRKRPDDLIALLEQADLFASERNRKDNALHNYRRVINLVRQMDPEQEIPGLQKKPEECIKDTMKRLQLLDAQVADSVRLAYLEFTNVASAAAQSYHQGGFPRTALSILDQALQLVAGDFALRALREEIQAESPVDVRRWRRLSIKPGLEDWTSANGWEIVGDGFKRRTDGLDFIYYVPPVPESFRFEVTVKADLLAGGGIAGLLYGSTRKGFEGFAAVNGDHVSILSKMSAEGVAALLPDSRELATIGVEVTSTRVQFFVGGKKVGHKDFEPGKMNVRLGLLVQQGGSEITRIRLKY